MTIVPAGPCAAPALNVGTCPAAGIRDIDVALDDMGDTLTVTPAVLDPLLEDLSVFGEAGNDNLTGAPNVKNSMQGGTGIDALTGGSLADDLSGNDDTDSMTGGAGDDLLRVADSDGMPDIASGGPGHDSSPQANRPRRRRQLRRRAGLRPPQLQ